MAANHRLSFSVKRFRDIDARPNTGDRPDSNRSVDHNSTHGVADRAYRNTDEILVTADHDRRRARICETHHPCPETTAAVGHERILAIEHSNQRHICSRRWYFVEHDASA
jgi:hypothetical protein